MADFKKLLVWQKAHALAMSTYRMAKGIRRTRDIPWRAQTIRAALSIPTNIVEGRRQITDKEFARFLRIALNSACELEYHLMVGRDIGVIKEKEAEAHLRDVIEVRRMLHGLLNKLAGRPKPPAAVPQNTSMEAETLQS
ncbi:MAG: four helix bundle protein [Gemmatimonadaceae bacterium]